MTIVRSSPRLVALCALVVLASICTSAAWADEYRAFWCDSWGIGMHNQGEVDQLLGVVGDPNSKGDIRNANCNAVFVQVRRNADVCYPSAMGEPYFSSVTPGFDAVSALCRAAHDTTGGKQRVEVHAWIVTFRTSGGVVYEAHNDPPTGSLTNLDNYWPTRTDGGVETTDRAFDPGHPLAAEYLTNVAMDLVTNFDIDGIHYDYIRYTANNEGYNPTSVARYNARYGLSGNPSSANEQWKQWRRDQVTALVRRIYAKIQAVKPQVKQSGAFVTWNPSPTASTRTAFMGTRPYYDVYSDWDSWIQEGIVDIAVPMTYYNYASLPSDWTRWINFEKDRKGDRHMVIGPGIYLNSLSNSILEIKQTRTASPAGNYAHGFSGYSYRVPYASGTWANFSPQLLAQVTQTTANIPAMPWKTNPTKGHISGTVTDAITSKWIDGATVSIAGPESRSMICDGTGFYAFIDVQPGTYTVTAVKSGYPNAVKTVTVAIGAVTGNMYVTDFSMGNLPAPVISNVQATGITTSGATITWTTDQASSSRVEYGTSTSYGALSPLDSTPITSHSVTLTGLSQSTMYHYRVIAANTNGSTTSTDYTFTTLGPPVILGEPVVTTTPTSATISWGTDVVSSGLVNHGTTASYGSQVSDPNSSTTSHSVTITGLSASTTYHFQCVSGNVYGSNQTADDTFTTASNAADIVIDNTDPGWTNTSPNANQWTVGSVSTVPKIGTNYLYRVGDQSLTESIITRKCRWTPNLPVAGTYDVYAYYQMGTNRNTAAPYKVFYDGGYVDSPQNQYSTLSNVGGWFLLARDLPFAVGSGGYVELTSLSLDGRNVSADACKWVLKVPVYSTAPVMTSVADETYTTSTTSLQASWAASEPESSITRYDYAVGSYPDATDVKGWTSAGTSTSVAITGLSLAVGGTYFISARAVNSQGMVSEPMVSQGVTIAYPVASIAAAKNLADGAPVGIPLASVSARFATSFYMQDASRASGIRVESAAGPAKDYTVQIFGRLGLVNGCERALLDCKIVAGALGETVEPLFMNSRWLGGEQFGAHTLGMTAGKGVNNVGLLVAIAGKVSALTPDGFYLDDGSGLQDDSANTGVKVWSGAPNSVSLHQTVVVTGVVSCKSGVGDGVYPVILARDIQ